MDHDRRFLLFLYCEIISITVHCHFLLAGVYMSVTVYQAKSGFRGEGPVQSVRSSCAVKHLSFRAVLDKLLINKLCSYFTNTFLI